MRVHPDHPVRDPLQPGHLLGEQGRVAALPAVAEHHHHGAAGHPALAPAVQEDPERLAQPGAAGPVGHGLAGGDQRPLGVALPQRPGQVGEPGADREVLHHAALAAQRDGQPVREPQQRVGVLLIEPDTSTNNTTRRGLMPRRRQLDRGRARPSGAGCCAASGARRPRRGARPGAAPTPRGGRVQGREHRGERGLLGATELGDVTVPQHLGGAGHRGQGVGVVVGGGAVALVLSERRLDQLGLLGPRPAARPRPSLAREPGVEDLVVAGEVVGAAAERGPAGPVRRLPVTEVDQMPADLLDPFLPSWDPFAKTIQAKYERWYGNEITSCLVFQVSNVSTWFHRGSIIPLLLYEYFLYQRQNLYIYFHDYLRYNKNRAGASGVADYLH